MDALTRVIGPLRTNTHLLADPVTREALIIDAAIPSLRWVADEVRARGWRLVLIVSTHGHWDHTGDNAPLQAWSREQAVALEAHSAGHAGTVRPASEASGEAGAPGGVSVVAPSGIERRLDVRTGADIAAHRDDWYRLLEPAPLFAPFPIPACVPAIELAEGGAIRLGARRFDILHTPGHTEGSVCLLDRDAGLLYSGDTLFAGGWGRVDFPGGDAAAMVDSLARLARLPDAVRVLPGHGPGTTIGRERPLLEMIAREGRLPG